MLNIVIPMAGRGSRFADAGYIVPKPLISLGGRPMIEWIIENVRPSRPHRFHFICLQDHLDRFPDMRAALHRICPGCTVTPVVEVTQGAACTVLLAREYIDSDQPLMIVNSDQFVEVPIDEYLAVGDSSDVAGLIMTFWADDPKWSYCRLGQGDAVSEVVEKEVVSNEATVGIYNFARGSDFVRSAEAMIAENLRVNGEFYVAPVYNQLIRNGEKIVVKGTGREYRGMYGLGIPADMQYFKTTSHYRSRIQGGQASRIRDLTEAYVWAFNARRLDGVSNLLRNDVVLVDPAGRFEGKDAVVDYIGGIFSSVGERLSFAARSITIDDASTRSVVEFELSLGERRMIGADVIEWDEAQMSALRAYLY